MVAAPTTSIDLKTVCGAAIKIEERPGWEVVTVRGPTIEDIHGDELEVDVNEMKTVKIAARGIKVFNPSFDVTPAELIDAIVTENGVVVKNEKGVFDMKSIFI